MITILCLVFIVLVIGEKRTGETRETEEWRNDGDGDGDGDGGRYVEQV